VLIEFLINCVDAKPKFNVFFVSLLIATLYHLVQILSTSPCVR